ncbi:hypothetical protein BSKO_01789 [Bryopsis sp. KO-2023]|nr:hypothetical protein BSKO_01789 [Bryopsis sp. KO-2023]
MAEPSRSSPVVHPFPRPGGSSDVGNRKLKERGSTFSFTSDCTVPSAETVEDAPICWICLDPSTPERELTLPCKCPRHCHPLCLARWQLQSAGTRRETRCEFCDGVLPDWRSTLTPDCGANAPAIMNVNFDGRTYSFEVKPGASGYLQFTEAIRHAFQLPSDSELNITFTCDEPCSALQCQEPPTDAAGNLLTLQGAGAYDAAVYCASVSAARRQMQSRLSHRTLSSPGLSSTLEEDPQPQRSNRDLQRSHTMGQLGHIFRPEEFIAQAQARNQGAQTTGAPVPASPSAVVRDERTGGGRHRGWSRIGRKIKSLFSRMVNK